MHLKTPRQVCPWSCLKLWQQQCSAFQQPLWRQLSARCDDHGRETLGGRTSSLEWHKFSQHRQIRGPQVDSDGYQVSAAPLCHGNKPEHSAFQLLIVTMMRISRWKMPQVGSGKAIQAVVFHCTHGKPYSNSPKIWTWSLKEEATISVLEKE